MSARNHGITWRYTKPLRFGPTRFGLAASLVMLCVATVHAAADRSGAMIELQPVVSAERSEMRVVERLPADFVPAGEALTLAFATLAPAYQRTIDQVTALTAQDDLGPLPLIGPKREQEEDVWRAGRPARGAVTLRYSVPSVAPDSPHRGPITYLQNSGGGLSGNFASFLLVPRSDMPIDIAVRWHLPPGEQAVSNVQIGDFQHRGSISDLAYTLFVAGPLVHAPSTISNAGLIVAGLARPQSEVDQSRQWFTRAFDAMRDTFRAGKEDGYRIMFLSHDRQGFHSGTSNSGGFLFFLPTGQRLDSEDNHPIIAHEMVHSFVRQYRDGTDMPSDWYNEGIADYGSIVIPKAAGLFTPQAYLRLVNEEAAFYYLNRLRGTPDERIPAIKWSGNRAWSLGYTRGAIYFANLDAGLRARHLSTTVFDLINRMNDRSETAPSGPGAWESLLRQHAGTWAVTEWRAMLAGHLIRPTPGAFGNCFVSRPVVGGHYDLGFSRTNLRKGDRINSVAPESNAFEAGLRDGDMLRETFVESGVDNQYDKLATVKIVRDGKPMDVTFAPRTGQETAYRWFARSGNPDRPCT